MGKLLVYGDSFASPSGNPERNDWPSRLASKLGYHIENYAVAGSSTDNAIQRLVYDHQNNRIEKNDVVIFIKSTPGRLAFQFQRERPETAALYLHDISKIVDDYKDSTHDWYRENKKYIEWYQINADYEKDCIIHESYTHLVSSIAKLYPNTIFLSFTNSHYYLQLPVHDAPPNYFEPKNFYLFDISENEIIDEGNSKHKYIDWTKHTKIDLRDNHLSQKNLEILTDICFEIIEKKTMDHATIDKFEKNIFGQIKTESDYMHYVNNGDLVFSNWRLERFKKISKFLF